jgi:hypothetical protein
MKFSEIFSKTIFRFFAERSFRKITTSSIESVLSRSVRMIDPQTVAEIIAYIKGQQSEEGGFKDRSGKCDLYYSLFGWYIAEALGIDEILPALKKYLLNIINKEKLTGVHQKCAIILYAKLFGSKSIPEKIQKHGTIAVQYSDFLNLLADYYSEDYASLLSLKRRLRIAVIKSEMPCSVTAAYLILNDSFGNRNEEPWKILKEFFRNGGFSAFKNTPNEDMLSTGVALYALRFVNSDLSIIKPECLTFIDSLYSDGGFCATVSDPDPDVEYTFYGLLGLGSLSD